MVDLLNFTVGMCTMFCLFENEHQVLTFLDFLNIQHPNLNFTTEKRAYETTLIFEWCSILVQTE